MVSKLCSASTNAANQGAPFSISSTKLYVPVATLSTQVNVKLLQQLKSGFKKTINRNKYISKPELLRQNGNLKHLAEPNFQGINRLFVLSFGNDAQRASSKGYYLADVKIKNYNVIIDGKNFIDQPVKDDQIAYENI